MGTLRSAGIAHQAYFLTRPDPLTCGDGNPAQVRVPELHAIVAGNTDEIAEATGVEGCIGDSAGGCSEDRIAGFTIEVDPAMAGR
jgi:hypothetical protein